MEDIKIKFTTELFNKLIDKFEDRAKTIGLKGKKKIDHQLEFIIGATVVIDMLNKDEQHSCLHPKVWICSMRGELMKKYEDEPRTNETSSPGRVIATRSKQPQEQ